jgi:hypothetical protein
VEEDDKVTAEEAREADAKTATEVETNKEDAREEIKVK